MAKSKTRRAAASITEDLKPKVAKENNIAVFYMAAALAIYERDGTQKQRHLNVLIQTDNLNLTKADLGTMNRTVLQRLQTENNVSPDMVRDVVFLGISLLGAMPPETFHGSDLTQQRPA